MNKDEEISRRIKKDQERSRIKKMKKMKNDKMRKSTSSCLGSHRGRRRHTSMVAIGG